MVPASQRRIRLNPTGKPTTAALHHLDEHPRKLHTDIPRTFPESVRLDDDMQQIDDELIGDDVIDLEDLIDYEHQTAEYDNESDAFGAPVPDDGFDDPIADDDDEQPVVDNAHIIPAVAAAGAAGAMTGAAVALHAMPASDAMDTADDDCSGFPDGDDGGLDAEDSPEEPSAMSASNPPMPVREESQPDADSQSADDADGKPAGLKGFISGFIGRMKSEIGGSDEAEDESEENPDSEVETDGGNDESEENPNDGNPDDDGNDEDKTGRNDGNRPSVNRNGSPVELAVSVLTLPFRMLMFALHAATTMMRTIISLCSLLAVLALVWLAFNAPAALHPASHDFTNDEGTLTAESVRYDSGKLVFTAVNKSDMIAHAGIEGEVKAWKPFAKLPASLFAPVKVMDCMPTYVDMDPNESKPMTMRCDGDSGFWMRPSVRITGE